MNTFLPSKSYRQSAKELDNKRLGKQRVECYQILKALLGESKGWANHPATKMWKGHEGSLMSYTLAVCEEWQSRGFKDSITQKVYELALPHVPRLVRTMRNPWWLGRRKFHIAMQSNLKRKDPVHYKQYNVPLDLPYQWPTEGKTFRVIIPKEKKNGTKDKSS